MSKKQIDIADVVEFLPTTGGGVDAIVKTADGQRAIETICSIIDFSNRGRQELVLTALEYYRKHAILSAFATDRLIEAKSQ